MKIYTSRIKAFDQLLQSLGFRDARILSDSMWRNEDGELMLHLNVHEGNKYFFRNITFKGNSIYTDEALFQRLKIQKEMFITKSYYKPGFHSVKIAVM